MGFRMQMTLTEHPPGPASAAARRAMIDSQLRTSGVTEPWILAEMGSLPRENFVPAKQRAAAYIDRAIDLGDGRWLAAPLVQGLTLREAAPIASDTALLVGEGEGYLAALLRPLVGELDAVAPADLAGFRGKGTYSLIVVEGAAEELPEALAAMLADDGRLVTGTVERGVTRLATGRKAAGRLALWPVTEIGIPVIPEFAARKRWSF
jgi:protein-L-isoaspartate(D-aspartate) O-methyltransferase